MNLYNVMVYYNGEGTTNIFLPVVGDVNLVNGRPLYLKNCGFNVIEALRQFRMMMVDFKIGAKQDGAYRIIDYNDLDVPVRTNRRVVKEKVSNADISSVLSAGTNGPIVLNENELPQTEESEPTVEPESTDYSQYTLKSGKYAGKTLAEVDKEGKLESVYNGFKLRNPEVKEAIEKYYEQVRK